MRLNSKRENTVRVCVFSCVHACVYPCVRAFVCVCACVRDLSLKKSVGLGAGVEGLKLRGLLHLRYLNALDILPQCLRYGGGP